MESHLEQLRSLYLDYLKACNDHDFDRMSTFYAPSIQINDAPMETHAVTAQFAPLIEAFPDWRWTVRNMVIDAEHIALSFSVSGTHRGTFEGIEATGRRVTISEFTIYRVEDDKFTHVWDLADFASLKEQIGQPPLS
ncbi:ester cyclase [Mycolicibacterium stellerae]|uniref:ester cyclase n=1 Tax=Mycolicibacterium stellerae TaxID=2358193 RepID=UPI000F0B8297|nr:ester cyclase [Mycolicibacterium stellerae]